LLWIFSLPRVWLYTAQGTFHKSMQNVRFNLHCTGAAIDPRTYDLVVTVVCRGYM